MGGWDRGGVCVSNGCTVGCLEFRVQWQGELDERFGLLCFAFSRSYFIFSSSLTLSYTHSLTISLSLSSSSSCLFVYSLHHFPPRHVKNGPASILCWTRCGVGEGGGAYLLVVGCDDRTLATLLHFPPTPHTTPPHAHIRRSEKSPYCSFAFSCFSSSRPSCVDFR